MPEKDRCRQESSSSPIQEISRRVPRVDSRVKTRGEALYLADLLPDEAGPEALYLRTVRSPVSRGILVGIDWPALPEGYFTVQVEDIPGSNGVQLIDDSWPIFAEEEVRYRGQPVGALCGPDRDVLHRLIRETKVRCREEKKGTFTLDEALEKGEVFVDKTLVKGKWETAFSRAARILEDTIETGYQEQVYMEPQSMAAWPEEGPEGQRIRLKGSMQCPYYVHKAAVHALGCGAEGVSVAQAVTGGAFGGKEDYPSMLASRLAVAAHKTGHPVVEIMDREEDLSVTCKRHPSRISFRTALDAQDRILGMDIDIVINAGAYLTYSYVVLQRAIFTSLGVYNIPHTRVRGRAAATNMVPSGAFRGFGAPQGTFGIETHMHHLAVELKRDPVLFKRDYFIRQGDATVTRGVMRDKVLLPQMTERLMALTQYAPRQGTRERIISSEGRLKGLGFSFFNHGCGFTGDGEANIIKAVVKVRQRADGRAEVLTANVEMGQGLTTAFRKIAAKALDLPLERVIYRDPDTDRVPNSGPTAASRSCMVVGYLVQEASEKLKASWKETPAKLPEAGLGPEAVLAEEEARFKQPPWIQWDQETLQGDAYPSYGWGVNAVEVEVDPVTYELFINRAWGIFDVGRAIDEQIIQGQIEGGMVQAFGYGSLEKMEIHQGRFHQKTMADYVIPTTLDAPPIISETMDNPYEFGPSGAKGAGELVFDGGAAALAAAVQNALGRPVKRIPLTPEYLMQVMTDFQDDRDGLRHQRGGAPS